MDLKDHQCGTEPCGTEPCAKVFDRFGLIVAKQQADGYQSIKDLINIHHENLKDELSELKTAFKDQGNEAFSRIRSLETKVTVIESATVTESKVKGIVSGNENIIWISRTRHSVAKVLIVVAAGLILAVVGFMPKIMALFH